MRTRLTGHTRRPTSAPQRPELPANRYFWGTGVSVTRRSPKPQRQVRFLGPPSALQSQIPRHARVSDDAGHTAPQEDAGTPPEVDAATA